MTHTNWLTALLLVLVFTGCGGEKSAVPNGITSTSSSSSSSSNSSSSSSNASSSSGARGGNALITPALTAATYQGASNGSAAVWNGNYFFSLDDEVNVISLFEAGISAPPVATWNVAKALKIKKEADFEGATRIDNTLLVISSHGRNADGKLKKDRFRFASMTITGEGENTQLTVNGYTDQLIQDILDPRNWQQPALDVVELIHQRSQLGASKDQNLAPKEMGLNIEGLTALPDHRVAIGFRNPVINGLAIVLTINNPLIAATGAKAQIGEAIRLDLAGYGIRGMTWSKSQNLVYIIAGGVNAQPDFHLYSWAGTPNSEAKYIETLTSPSGGSIEAVLPHDKSNALRLLLDQDTILINGKENKSLSIEKQRFEDLIYSLN